MAIHSTHGINKDYRNRPHRNEVELPWSQSIVPQPLLATARTDCPRSLSGTNIHLDVIIYESDTCVDKTLDFVDSIEHSLNLHRPWSPVLVSWSKPILPELWTMLFKRFTIASVALLLQSYFRAKRSRALRGRNPTRDNSGDGEPMMSAPLVQTQAEHAVLVFRTPEPKPRKSRGLGQSPRLPTDSAEEPFF